MERMTRDYVFLCFFILSIAFVPFQFVARCYVPTVTLFYVVSAWTIATVFSLFLNCIEQKWGIILKTVLLFFVTIYSCINAFVWYNFECLISSGVLDIVLATNRNEAIEFWSQYGSWTWICIIVVVPSIWVGLYQKLFTFNRDNHRSKIIFFLLPFIGFFSLSCYAPKLMFNSITGELWSFSSFDHVELRQYKTHPSFSEIRTDHPEKVVIILGESFARSHSSVYGYSKETNPKLAQLAREGSLIVYSDVKSPATSTLESLRRILTTYSQYQQQVGEKWYLCPNLIDIAQTLGYQTCWISNQSCLPMFDDLSTAFANLCEEQHFNKDDGSGMDEFVLGFNYAEKDSLVLIIYHLMGQHGVYEKRCPDNFRKFSISDYSELPDNQRKVIADYDNATLYNDYVVATLMEYYSNSDAVVFYFPDHGQDLFETSKDHFGHGRLGNPASVEVGKTIPFFVFAGTKFQILHPESYEQLKKHSASSFETSNFYQLVLDVMGYKLIDFSYQD